MNIELQPSGAWYHGSNQRFNVLREGSTVTQWKALAEAFSHKPSTLCYDDEGNILHNGREHGYLYIIDEPVSIETDVYPHPRSAMDPNAELLTKRALKVRLIGELPTDPSSEEALNAFLLQRINNITTTNGG